MELQGLKILIVDDSSINRKLVSMLLENMGCIVDEAKSGAASLTMVKDKKYDVIFMDHIMPGMNGIEALCCMKEMKDSLNLDTPVIALTADDSGNGKAFYIKNGFKDYLVKPVPPNQYQEAIERVLKA